MKDILIFMSDQHSPLFSEWGSERVDTPNLMRLRDEGTSFEAAYTSCPLCVPARMSMMSGLIPGKTGVFTNNDTLSSQIPCFTHALAAAGYETVLIGRMHFVGTDQRHGFTKRLAADMTPTGWNRPVEQLKKERGDFAKTFGEPWCTDVVGAGESPVLHYDEQIVQTALAYLDQEHEKPQFIIVGTYGPHFPYVAPEELYLKYSDRVSIPKFFNNIPDYMEGFELLKNHCNHEVTENTVRGVYAAYCGMVEKMDSQIGQVRDAFLSYARKKKNGHVFGYLSDHGDQAGERRIFGKQTFFEKSVRIPMIFEGTDIRAGKKIISPVSILDLAPTLCDLAETAFCEEADGKSLKQLLTQEGAEDYERVVISQFTDSYKEKIHYGIMLRYRECKFISYHGYERFDLLFDLKNDPEETVNIIEKFPKLREWFVNIAGLYGKPEEIETEQYRRARNLKWFQYYEKVTGWKEKERWTENPPSARGELKIIANFKKGKINR
ncbi:choline-sulfatase [Anaerocolumna cellulosilytica]|uniref:Choline-sulfatase n=1 Tax=Anaerocolumna cellulosilytica TaxID=433286 RepID=A0A6S6RBZ3_9FIRM|nr:sulfatase-like hydrolase/transferase [Anaerocolumna cellulosilytica]MBB5196262.1 choline-sulfatase [Anaerocolumna cellulosilytica]BCJ96291.1 choline-sulfatase [Anaerocolumna cellulosilytica]